MLKKQMKQYISELLGDNNTIELFKEEKEYLVKNEFISSNITVLEKDPVSRFSDAYIERCDKESEEMIGQEAYTFLNQPIRYFQKHKKEFIYLESKWFEMIGVDAVSLEVDDVFGTYGVMLGLQLQKKFGPTLEASLKTMLQDDEKNFQLMFNNGDGLWDLNFPLNFVDGFNEELSIGEAYSLIYRFLFNLVETVEKEI